MGVHIIKELQRYDFYELKKFLGIDDEHVKKAIGKLTSMKLLKRLTPAMSDEMRNELLENIDDDVEIDYRLTPVQDTYVFRYVGVLVVKGQILLCYPKYMNDDSIELDAVREYSKFRRILEVTKIYNERSNKTIAGIDEDGSHFNLLGLGLTLLRDYHIHGLYRKDQDLIELNGEGEILWERTINMSPVYFSNQTPFYLDVYTHNTEENESNFFRLLHACILTEISNQLASVLPIVGVEGCQLTSQSLADFGSSEYIIYRLNQEIAREFNTYKLQLLTLFKTYVEESEKVSDSEEVYLAGSDSFHHVWENVCAVVMGDCFKSTLKSLGLTYQGLQNINPSMTVENVIAKPTWIHAPSQTIHQAKDTLTPDIISIKDGELAIYDAKYYNIHLDDKRLSGQPGIESITKQYLYELAYKEFARENHLVITENAFLLPCDGDEEVHLGVAGFAPLDNLIGISLQQIKVILKPCDLMYRKYLEA